MKRQTYRPYEEKSQGKRRRRSFKRTVRRFFKRLWRLSVCLLPVIFAAVLLGAAAWAATGGREMRSPVMLKENEPAGGSEAAGREVYAYTTAAPENYEEDYGEENGNDGAGFRLADEEISTDDGQVVLLFAGDVYLSNYVLNAYDAAGGIAGVLDEGIRREIAGADIFMVNQEFPFTDRGQQAADKQFTFRIPPARVNILKEMDVDIVTMANNHILDYGPDGITDSLAALDGAGIRHVGAGENLEQASRLEVIETDGMKIGFLGTSRVYMDASWAAGPSHPGVFSTYEPAAAVKAISQAKDQCDYLVAYVHWGVEKATEPQDYQRTMGRQYLDAGADLVVGSHPHVLQEIEYYGGKPIVHSLGNFVFGSSIPETELLKVVIKDGQAEVSTIPCRSSNGYTRLK